MRMPLCFCNGVIRSGSTWSFNVCRALFQELSAQLNLPFGSTYLDGAYAEHFVSQQWQQVPGPAVIKAHQIGPVTLATIRAGHAKAVCTFRDPRDCVASDLVFMGQGLEFSINRVSASLEFLRFYQSTSHILLVKYEEMMADRIGQIRRIAAHLQIKSDDAMIARVDAATNIDSSRQVCQDLKNRAADQVLNIASHKVDPQTHLHEHHIGRATPGRWRDEFSADQASWLTEYFSPWLLQLGYETRDSLRSMLGSDRTGAFLPGAAVMPISAAPPFDRPAEQLEMSAH
jgi:hypothetical protein